MRVTKRTNRSMTIAILHFLVRTCGAWLVKPNLTATNPSKHSGDPQNVLSR